MDKKTQLTADTLFRCFIAALAKDGTVTLDATRPQIHRAFRKVLEALQELPYAREFDVDITEIDFDPLYGQSSWLDRELTRAQRRRAISFPNPTYERMQIKLDPSVAKTVLAEIGSAHRFVELAWLFRRELPNGNESSPTT